MLSVVLANPICQAISVFLAAVCYLTFRGREAWRFIGGLAVVLLVVTLSAPLFNTQGATVLFRWWGGRPYTLEALALGASTGLMLVAMMLWFASYHLVMTSDKFTYLFGRAIPALSLTLIMVLRLVPSYRRKADALMTARACIGKGPSGRRLCGSARARRRQRSLVAVGRRFGRCRRGCRLYDGPRLRLRGAPISRSSAGRRAIRCWPE